MKTRHGVKAVVVALAAGMTTPALGVTNPYTEDFDFSSANWRLDDAATDLGWSPTGGPDGPADTFAFATRNFVNNAEGDFAVTARTNVAWGSSFGNIHGDYISAGVNLATINVRHDLPVPVNFFSRFTGAAVGTPAVSSVTFTPVAPGAWTTLTFPLEFGNPQVFNEGPPTEDFFNLALSNVFRTQFGIFGVPAEVAGLDQDFTIEIDDFTIVPSPATAAMLAPALGMVLRRRRA